MLTCVGSGCQQQIAEVELAVVLSNRAKDMVSVTLQELQCKHAEVNTEDQPVRRCSEVAAYWKDAYANAPLSDSNEVQAVHLARNLLALQDHR